VPTRTNSALSITSEQLDLALEDGREKRGNNCVSDLNQLLQRLCDADIDFRNRRRICRNIARLIAGYTATLDVWARF